jgi:BASS family bile acid:Na+ symporter
MDTASLVKGLNVIALVAIMLSIGLKVGCQQIVASARDIRLVAASILANFVLVPLVTAGILYCFQAPPLVSAGFLILAVCPGAPVVPPFTGIAKGDVALATGLMAILAALSALLAPVLLTLLLSWRSPESELRVSFLDISKMLLVTQLAPLGVGLWFHAQAPKLTRSLVQPITLLANLLLVGVVGLILATQYQTLLAFHLRGWIGMMLLLAATLGIGWLCGGPSQVTRRTLTVTTGVRNAAVGLVIVSANFAGTAAVTAVVAYALVSIFGTLACAFLFRRFAFHELAATPSVS